MRPYWMSLVCCSLLAGCGSYETNALNLRPLATYAIEQEPDISLDLETQQKLLTYCEQEPTDILPTRRAEVARAVFYHPLYQDLGKKTIKYWASGADRYVTCLNSNEIVERTFKIDPVDEYETLTERFTETEGTSELRFEKVTDVAEVARQFRINDAHETILPDSAYRYVTPDTGSFYVTYETIRGGRTLDPILEPGLLPFESGNNEGYVFLTKRADDRIALQIGNAGSLRRVLLPNLFMGEWIKIDAREEEVSLKSDHRQLLRRVVFSDRPVDIDIARESSVSLSKTYGTVLEIWGHVRRPVVNKMSRPPASGTTRLAYYSSDGKGMVLDGPKTEELFQSLKQVETAQKPSTAKRQGQLTIYEALTEQHFTVWLSADDLIYLVDQRTKYSYVLPVEEYDAWIAS
ncbi:hypothetical protein [Exiguobacterium algae]|uniref:hypothetical protein n=1 Tax=Exiguobacterium algae TaxID=2751250 RepID=UPI001BE646A0|nr:hypothetical protein [Exiguobacterium algae]